MILIDTSAWVEFLRNTGSQICEQVDRLLERETYVCEPVVMELLAGARNDAQLTELRRLLARCTTLQTTSADFEMAAAIFRQCRRGGKTPRKMLDCLIAAIAIRNDASLLHCDQDFLAIAEHSSLSLATI